MFALTILGIVGAALTSLIIDASRSMLWAVNKSEITNDVRSFPLRIGNETVNANFAYLYPDFTPGSLTINNRLASGLSGDCLVLVYTEPFPNIDSQPSFERIIVYFRTANATGLSPVFRAEANFPLAAFPTDAVTPFENFLAAQIGSFGPAVQVLELSRGLTSNNQLFRAADDNTFVINGEIIHGTNIQRVTNTFNLTISTRG